MIEPRRRKGREVFFCFSLDRVIDQAKGQRPLAEPTGFEYTRQVDDMRLSVKRQSLLFFCGTQKSKKIYLAFFAS